ncbi:MAG: sigma-70 family RNA polymerase sigma factor [Planctomycetaceae bacterium]|jgi:RNA polymerase primary sigma factor|nr:sigma-70 family RNA polymerase sigma factor [Planctomycetaceae bacterium]
MTKPATTDEDRAVISFRSPLDTYLKEINETALLTQEEECKLATAVQQGDSEARDLMVRSNLRLVVNIARGYGGRGIPLQDLVEEGNLGLIRAVEGYDPKRETRFSTYASYWIKQSIKRSLIYSGRHIRIPAYMLEILAKWQRASARLLETLGRTPTYEEIARRLGLPRKKLPLVKKAILINNLTLQTDRPEVGWTINEMVIDERRRQPDEAFVESDSLTFVMGQIAELDPRDAAILKMRYGLDGYPTTTLKEIGARLGLTRERVRQIEIDTLKRLEEFLEGTRPVRAAAG